MKHAQEAHPPRVLAGALVDQHRHALVNGAGQLGIHARAEDRQGARVGVEQGDLRRAEREAPAFVAQVLHAGGKEGKLRLLHRRAGKRQQAEFHAAVHCREEFFPVLEVIQADDAPLFHLLGKEDLVGVVGGNAGGDDHPDPAALMDQLGEQLGEYAVGVDVAPPGEGIAPAVTQELGLGFRTAQGFAIFLP